MAKRWMAIRAVTMGEVKATRFDGLVYQRQGDAWRFLGPAPIGPQYRTERELLADLVRFAEVSGFSG